MCALPLGVEKVVRLRLNDPMTQSKLRPSVNICNLHASKIKEANARRNAEEHERATTVCDDLSVPNYFRRAILVTRY